MKTATISDAKNNLSAYIRLVKQGEEILILDRDTPVARLTPIDATRDLTDDVRLRELRRKGIVSGPQRRGLPKKLLTPPPKPKRPIDLVGALIEDRESGW